MKYSITSNPWLFTSNLLVNPSECITLDSLLVIY